MKRGRIPRGFVEVDSRVETAVHDEDAAGAFAQGAVWGESRLRHLVFVMGFLRRVVRSPRLLWWATGAIPAVFSGPL